MKTSVMNENLIPKINEILDAYQRTTYNLLAILLEVQSIIPQQYIPIELAEYVSKELEIPLSRIYDVITFYSALSDQPRSQHVIQLCKSTVCRVNKYQTLRSLLEKELGINVGGITEDGKFSLIYSACFGACDISPAFRINEKIYGNLTEKKVKDIIEMYRRM